MNFRRARRDEPEINMISLVDVVLLLVVFFMVSTTFNRPAELSVELPKATAQAAPTPTSAIEIIIDADGGYHLNKQRLINTHRVTLTQAIRGAAGDERTQPFIISADAKAPHQAVVTVMDVAGQLGFTKIQIAATHMDNP